jgi:hypothetical protein
VERGDSLVLNLTPAAPGGFQFQRDVYASREAAKNVNNVLAVREPGGSWKVAELENRHNGRNRDTLRLMVTTEKVAPPVPFNVSLRQVHPSFVWFHVAPGSEPERRLTGLRFMPLADYPAPAWDVQVADWPGGQRTVLDVSMLEADPPVARKLVRGSDFKELEDLAALTVKASPSEREEPVGVRVEGVRQERRQVEVRPGKVVDGVDCLVVRLSYPPGGQPFFVQLPGEAGAIGHEHRFYTEAGKYTGIFWNVRKDQADALQRLDLISVAGALEKAFRVENLDLGVPNMQFRPPPLVKPRN